MNISMAILLWKLHLNFKKYLNIPVFERKNHKIALRINNKITVEYLQFI